MSTITNPDKKNLYFRLAKAMNYSFGTQGPGEPTRPVTQKVNLLVRDDSLVEAKYIGFVTFTSDKNLDSLTFKFKNEAYSLIEASLKRLSEDFKNENDSKLEFKINKDTERYDVEYLHINNLNSVRRAFFKLSVLVDVIEK